MNKLSVVITGRDDDYEGDFLTRLHTSITKNCEAFERQRLDYEYIIVEWCPFKDYLIINPKFKDVFSNSKVREIIVDKTVSDAEELFPDTFYEYFAKNAGIRKAKHDSILLTNSDIIFPLPFASKMAKLVDYGLHPDQFYRPMYRSRVHPQTFEIFERGCLHNPEWIDAHVCGAYSGDFLLARTDTITNKGRGYDEENPAHRSKLSQTNMDGEILSNMYENGVRLAFIEHEYWHLEHSKNAQYDSGIFGHRYTNKDDWGFIKYPTKVISDQLEIIHA